MASGYDDILMDHIRNARNYREIVDADERVERNNLVCGDRVEIYVRWDGETLADASFQCECCGVAMASASIMTERLVGKPRRDIAAACDEVLARLEAAARPRPARRAAGGGAAGPAAGKPSDALATAEGDAPCGSAASEALAEGSDAGETALVGTVARYPVRARCAALPWQCLRDAARAGGGPG